MNPRTKRTTVAANNTQPTIGNLEVGPCIFSGLALNLVFFLSGVTDGAELGIAESSVGDREG